MDKLFDVWIYGVGGIIAIFLVLGFAIFSFQELKEKGGISRLWSDFVYDIKKLAQPIIRFLTGCLLGFAVLPQPNLFYQVLRWAVCGMSVLSIWHLTRHKKPIQGWLFVIPAVIFNPIAPFYLGRSTWEGIDILAALYFSYSALFEANEILGD